MAEITLYVAWSLLGLNLMLLALNWHRQRQLNKICQAEFEVLVMMWQMRRQASPEEVAHMRMIAEFEAFREIAKTPTK